MTAIQQMLMGTGSLFPSILWDNIGGLAEYLATYMSEYRNPSFYFYSLDGDSTYINDGGSDMFDIANFTTPVLNSGTDYAITNTSVTAYPFRISYSNTSPIIVDGDFKYASLGYSGSRLPLTVIGTRYTTSSIGWQKGGNVGADGFGNLATSVSTAVIGGFTVYYFVRQINGTSDPTVCDVYMLIGHPNWGSEIGPRTQYSIFNTNSHGGRFFASSSTAVLTAVTLLSKPSGALITNSEILTVVTNFVNRIKLYFDY